MALKTEKVLAIVAIDYNGRRCEEGPGVCCRYATCSVDSPAGAGQHYCHLFRTPLRRESAEHGSPTLRTRDCLATTNEA